MRPSPDPLASFLEFSTLKTQVNGPDVHMRTALAGLNFTAKQLSFEEAAWWVCIYTTFCSVPPALAVWAKFPEPGLALGDEARRWVERAFVGGGLPVRTQRRPVRSGPKLATCLQTVATWCGENVGRLRELSYEEAWASVDGGVRYYGRYVIIKLLEALRRLNAPQLEAPDIRPRGGWSPRRALGYIYPDAWESLTSKSDTRDACASVNAHASDLLPRLEAGLGRASSFYELEVLLCNWRQATYSGTLYVGRTIDSELEYQRKCERYWGSAQRAFDVFEIRQATFPRVCLGELNGWNGVRKELKTYRGYYWSDVLYDWAATTDLDNPVRRA